MCVCVSVNLPESEKRSVLIMASACFSLRRAAQRGRLPRPCSGSLPCPVMCCTLYLVALYRAMRLRFGYGFDYQRTPWGGGKERGVENLTNDTPPKKGFWTPLVRYVFHPPQVSVLCFSCTKIYDRVDQKLFWRGPKIFGRARSLVRFPPPIRFAPPHITAQD